MNARAQTDAGAADRQPALDVAAIRREFKALDQEVHGRRLVYLDNAATSQKPACVVEALLEYYEHDCANIHRGVHALSQRATLAYEGARERIAHFLGTPDEREIIFVRGATEGINLVAQAHLDPILEAGDEILLTHLEHHSNIVPWQLVAERHGATVKAVPIDDRGVVDLEAFASMIGARTRFAALSHVSNAIGTINPIEGMVAMCKERGIPVLVDGAQAVPHLPVRVRDIGADFYTFSGHKVYGPTGVGVLWGRSEILEGMRPWQGGGDMIASVSFEKTTFNSIPHRFEAGTPAIASGIGLARAIDWLGRFEWSRIQEREQALLDHATRALRTIPGLRLIGTAPDKVGVISFVLEGVHPHDIGTILDMEGVAIRAGHHCAEPVMRRFGVPATARASFAIYSSDEEVDALVAGIRKVQEMFGDV